MAVNQPQMAVVGWLSADAPLDFLNRTLLTVADPEVTVTQIILLAESAEQAPDLVGAVGAVLDAADPSSVAIRSSDALVRVRAAVQGELGTWGRNLVGLVLCAGLVLTALNVLGAETTRRRDFGRRRALGASRLDIMILVTAQTVLTAIVGATAGVLIGTAVVRQILGIQPEMDFGLAVAVLAVIAATIAAMPPAVIAAYRDPVRILRVP